MNDRFHPTPIAAVIGKLGRIDPGILSSLPQCYRLTSIERLPVEKGYFHRAKLFHEQAAMTVSWTSRHPDTTLTRHCLVSIRWCLHAKDCVGGDLPIARLVRLDRPLPAMNLFETIPTYWVADRDLVSRCRDLWEKLPKEFKHLFNGIFWDGHRFERYLTGPSSLNGHHNVRNGNFRHCLEVAEQALVNGAPYETSFPPVLIMAGLLHDAGKADEYVFDSSRQRYAMSERGQLIGHKQTILEWIAAAQAKHNVVIPNKNYLSLIHALTATKGAPAWMGLREPQSLEASILSKVDRLSGEGDLHRKVATKGDGFGQYHPHLGTRPFSCGS